MGSSGFENWSDAKIAEHNQRVRAGAIAYKRRDTNESVVKHLIENPKANIAIASSGKPIVNIERKESTDVQQLNKLETRFHNLLQVSGHQQIFVQSIILKLADRCRYTVDFVVLTKDGKLVAYECKGPHAWEDSIIKLKTAARMFPIFEFVLVKYEHGQWIYKTINP